MAGWLICIPSPVPHWCFCLGYRLIFVHQILQIRRMLYYLSCFKSHLNNMINLGFVLHGASWVQCESFLSKASSTAKQTVFQSVLRKKSKSPCQDPALPVSRPTCQFLQEIGCFQPVWSHCTKETNKHRMPANLNKMTMLVGTFPKSRRLLNPHSPSYCAILGEQPNKLMCSWNHGWLHMTTEGIWPTNY